ncbi:MAG: hypothetical protein QGF16_21950 [Rhodospirillales bacterium]|jgi:hypothetical protein|nr:hypothetical protein [Rhodospirillales bacterium]|tara:strand:- start:91 stop:561 length:471 start_codon:yes stop_codon:yes gene_type:complete
MKRGISVFGVLALSLALAACADRPPYGDAKIWLEEIDPGKGRVFVYRNRNPLTMMFPFTFVFDGKKEADFYSGTGFYRDVKAGNHTITYNHGKKKLEIEVPENGRVFIKYAVVADLSDPTNMVVEVVPVNVADREMERTILIEGELPVDRGPRIFF